MTYGRRSWSNTVPNISKLFERNKTEKRRTSTRKEFKFSAHTYRFVYLNITTCWVLACHGLSIPWWLCRYIHSVQMNTIHSCFGTYTQLVRSLSPVTIHISISLCSASAFQCASYRTTNESALHAHSRLCSLQFVSIVQCLRFHLWIFIWKSND